MKHNEKLLFKELCKFKSDSFDESLLSFATPNVLGQLFFNRMQGVAYGVLKKHGLKGKVNREFRNSLQAAYEQNTEKNLSFFKCVEEVAGILSDSEDDHAYCGRAGISDDERSGTQYEGHHAHGQRKDMFL